MMRITPASDARRAPLSSLRGVALAPPVPAAGRGVVRLFGADPGLALLSLFLLPERRPRLEIIHQEFGGRKGRLAVGRGGHHQHDIVARYEPAIAVDDGDAEQRPALLRLRDMA